MARTRRPAGGRLRIEAEALDVRKDEEAPQLVAYAFGQSGRLLARTELTEGTGDLQIPEAKEPEAIRVVVGPRLEQEDPGEILTALTRLDAPERTIRPGAVEGALRFPVDRVLWLCWLRFCTVRGTLLKRVTTGGVHVDLPVCGAEVEIYEVDPIPVILPKIPDIVLERVRDLVRKPFPPPPPEERFPGGIPFPPRPGPGPDPAPFLGGFVRRAAPVLRRPARVAAALEPMRAEVASLMSAARGFAAEAEGGEAEAFGVAAPAEGEDDRKEQAERQFTFQTGEATEVSEEEALASVRALAGAPEIAAAAGTSLTAFKTALLARPELIRPLICWLWPWAVTTQLVATVTTDECGKFRALVYVGCSSDQPDLYFQAYRRIGFFRFPIYAPTPIACHTWWNYACGSEVTLITTSPFAQTCPPCQPVIAPDHWVLAMAVGNTSLAAVRGTSVALQATTTSSNVGLTGGGAPWGGYLRLRFEFDHTLRTDLNVRYYRVRWRKFASGNPWVDLDEAVWRHYAHMVGSVLMIEPYSLGPQAIGGTPNLYEIPPALPPLGQWSIPDAVVDTTSAAFRSAALAPGGGGEGLYEFELTLFDGAGNAVNANTLGISYRVPTTLDLTATIPTANAALLGLVTGAGRLVYRLHVDNNECTAAVQPPEIGGTASADPCGLLRYDPGDSVTLEWQATHPNGFATFHHGVVKGATPLAPPVSSSGVVGPAPGTHVETHAVATLLGSCTIAGFAETVSVWAMATDGWSRQSGYDDHAIQAFALAPEGA
jgi:hypothetical protein